MKNVKYIAMLAIGALLASCDPTTIEGPSAAASMTEEQLQSTVTLQQTVPNQNKFTYSTSPATYVQILDQDGSILSSGTSGSFVGVPPLTSITVRAINQDGSLTSFSQACTITEYVDVPEVYKFLFGDEYLSQTWVWDTEATDGVWGNGGYMSNSGPGWWIVSAADIDEQCEGKDLPQDGLDGWMTFTLAGKKVDTSRGESGTISWDLSAIAKEGWDQGTLTFSGTIPLLGVQPNAGNARQYEYHILQMDGEHLRLCAPEAGAGEGGTAWFWNFKKQ